ncbi:hypothetical protein GCM10022225_26770 [Plantactinospora mayteni]|uniref:DUF4145 domain-containing protein n=1 Tax=Plantactinospora mayteni TaxID=566021 RepID=A0ABQ4EIN9_9ACTN|nr:hypothetical protein [Plantactinospora mayteni]GIG94593.1 hypothetical protein Pma05_11660 [Plantactinospora mayteni]
MTADDRLVCLYALPQSLLISEEILDDTYQVRIAGRSAVLHLPIQAPDSEDLAAPAVLSTEERVADFQPRQGTWGAVLPGEPFTNDGAHLQTVVIIIECPTSETQSIAEDLPDTLAEWFKRLREWIRVLVNQPLRPISPIHNRGHGLTIFREAGTEVPERMSFRQSIRLVRRERETLSRDLWTVALKAVSASELPAPAHTFVADAREALDGGDHRRAVLDAATAAELALAHLFDVALGALDTGIRGAILRERRTLGSFIATIANAGMLPPGVTQDGLSNGLTRVRNMAIHKGRPPGRDQAQTAVDIGAAVVRGVFPLG